MAKTRRTRSHRGKGTKRRRGGQYEVALAAMGSTGARLAAPIYGVGKRSVSSAYNGAKGLASSAYGSANSAASLARNKANGFYGSMFKRNEPQPTTMVQPGMGGRRTRRRRRRH